MPGPKTKRVAARQLSHYEMDFLTKWGIHPGAKRRRAGESTEDLLDRIEIEARDILIMTEGSVPAVCAVFDQPHETIETLIAASDALHEALEKGEQIARLRIEEGLEAAKALQEFALKKLKEENRLTTHGDDWPRDPEMFHVELKAIIPQALRDYGGSVIQMSEPLSATISEIETIISADESLQRLQMICLTKDDAAAEANFAEKAATGPAAGAHKFLTNRQPDKYGDKSKVEVTNVGIGLPPEDFGTRNVLNRKKNEESEK